MAWIKSFQELGNHPKLKRAARTLGICCPQLVGHLHYLWWWALEYAQDGDLTGYTVEDIADAAGWEGDASAFVEALVGCGVNGGAGFLERGEDGRLYLHDWSDYAGKLLERRATERERIRARRTCTQYVAPTDAVQTQDVVCKSRVEKSRVDKREICAVPAPQSLENPPNSADVSPEIRARIREVWEYYRAKIQPKARVCPDSKIRCRLKRFSVEELKLAIDRFAANYWWRSHNARQGGEWFFRSDSQIDRFLLLEPETREQCEAKERRNGLDMPRAAPGFVPARRKPIPISEVI